MYENDAIFDKFDLQISPDSSQILTGGYNASAHVIDVKNSTNTSIEANYIMSGRGHVVGETRPYKGRTV